MRVASLSMATGGIVAEVLVREGDPVEAGQVLVRLTGERQQAVVSQAKATLQATQAQLEQLRRGARQQEIAAAQAALDAAQAQLDRLLEGASPEEVTIAEAGLASAQATRWKVLEGPREEELTAARAELANAGAVLKHIQAEYDRVGWRNDRAALSVSLELEQATNTYTATRARYAALAGGVTDADIAGAEAGVQMAEAELARVRASVKRSDIAAAKAEIRRVQAQLELLQAGTRPEQIAAAEANVAAAEATLEQTKIALRETELRAPFAGTVALLSVKPGERVAPGVPVAQLADLSQWQIETEDLTEIQVVGFQEGSRGAITFDAIPDVELPGKVVRIQPIGEAKHGDMTYTVIIQPDGYDPRMRWNMTALVAIEPGGL